MDLRKQVVQYLEENNDKMQASQLFQVGIATVYRWVKRKKQRGNVEPLKKKITYEKIDDQRFIAYVEKNPDHFLSEIAKHFGLISDLLRFEKTQDHKKKKIAFYQERNTEARAEYLKKIEAISPEKRVYLDQSGISQYARSARGKQLFGGISGKRFGRQSVISALQGKKLLPPMCFAGTCNTDLFNVWLKQELIPNLTHGQVLILDNASFHTSKTTRT